MNTNELLSLLFQTIFIVLGFVTIINYLRQPDKRRRNIALMFGALGVTFFIQVILHLTAMRSPILTYVSNVALASQPYLLLCLVEDFRSVPKKLTRGIAAAMIISWVALATAESLSTLLRVIGLIIIIGYFVIANGYAAVTFVRGALTTSGVVRQRLRFAAAGSGLMAGALLSLALTIIAPLKDFFTTLMMVAAIGSALSYYIAFVPPRWLRRMWQFTEVRDFLLFISSQSIGESHSISDNIKELCYGAIFSVGGMAAGVATRDETTKIWRMSYVSGELKLPDGHQDTEGIIEKVWRGHKPLSICLSDNLNVSDRHLLETVGAETLLIAPISTRKRDWGPLLVFLKRSSLFIEDDLDLVSLLAQQGAIFLENRALVLELSNYSGQLEKRVEERTQELQQSREQYRRIVETAQEGIWVFDIDINVTFVNARMSEMLGYTIEEIMQHSVLDFLDDENRSKAEAARARRRQGIQEQYELTFQRKDGSALHTLVSASPVTDDNGKFMGMMAMVADITERKQAEEQILKLNAELEQRVVERTAQLSAVNQELEAFSYSVSHDLRAPLRTLDGFSQALLEDYSEKLDEEGQSFLRRIRLASQRMGHLIDAMLQLSRVSRTALRLQKVDLSQLAHSIAVDLREQRPQLQVEFVTQDMMMVLGDEAMLRIVLTNLLNNAWKFSSTRQQPRVEFGLTTHNERQAYFVRDNGVGFDMTYANKLFGAFQRLHQGSQFEGTGIGLATVARIIRLHSGDIWADATLDKGATFFFTLPME